MKEVKMDNDIKATPEENQFMFLSYPVYVRGNGKGVILMHELPGLTPECLEFADCLVEAGFRVYLPLFFGNPNESSFGQNINSITVPFCLNKEFGTFATGKSSPITVWLKKLCQHIHQEYHSQDEGIGVIGMCLTGGFVLAMMVEPSVIAPVISQPALPLCSLTFWDNRSNAKEDLGVSQTDLNQAKARNIPLLGMRFEEDWISPCARFEKLKREFSPECEMDDNSIDLTSVDVKNSEGKTIVDETKIGISKFSFSKGRQFYHYVISAKTRKREGLNKRHHSVLTGDYKKDTSTEVAREWVKAFLKSRLD
jgi:dienelactone hydrolase